MNKTLKNIERQTNGHLSPIVTILLAVNIIVYMLQGVSVGDVEALYSYVLANNLPWDKDETELLVKHYLVLNEKTFFSGQVWRLLTAGFTHADIRHLIFNMLPLCFLAAAVSNKIKSLSFLLLVLSSILISNLSHVLFYDEAVLGFSGAVMAILVAFATLNPHTKLYLFFVLALPAWVLIVLLILLDLSGMFGAGVFAASNTAHSVHLVGAAVGFLFIKSLPLFNHLKAVSEKNKEYKSAELNERQEEYLEFLLAKVSSDGLPSLTKEEREFLLSYSENME